MSLRLAYPLLLLGLAFALLSTSTSDRAWSMGLLLIGTLLLSGSLWVSFWGMRRTPHPLKWAVKLAVKLAWWRWAALVVWTVLSVLLLTYCLMALFAAALVWLPVLLACLWLASWVIQRLMLP